MIGLFEDWSRRHNFIRTMATSNSNKEVDRKLFPFTAALLACYLLASTARAADKLPEELLVVRAQPAVFMILAVGDVNLSYPQHVTTIKNPSTSASQARALVEGLQSLLAAEYARDQRDGVIAKGKARSEYYWEKITENPQRYLVASKELLHRTLRDVPYSSGTGFAISRDGIFLTNAHVVRDTHQLADALLGQPFEDLLDNLAREFGSKPPDSKPPDAMAGDSWKPLARWFILQSGGSGKFKQAQMVLKFDAVESFGQ
jgi:S1-C subfamily serine protease